MRCAYSTRLRGGKGSAQMAGFPGRKMPAFSKPIFSRVSPRNSMCSRSILLIIAQSVSMILTASSRPPRPTSRITASSARRETVQNRQHRKLEIRQRYRFGEGMTRTLNRFKMGQQSFIAEHLAVHARAFVQRQQMRRSMAADAITGVQQNGFQ